METGLFTWNLKNRLSIYLILVLLFGCEKPKEKHQEKFIIDSSKIENAYLICRLGNGYFSNFFKKYASKEQKYSHIGIISKENDSIYVYHSEASELTGIGYVKREKLNLFLNEIKVFDFYKLKFPETTKTQILNSVKSYYKNKTPFDIDFNSLDDHALYCTELIARAINNNVEDSIKITPSLSLAGKNLYALDDIYLNKNVKKIKIKNTSPES